MSTTTTTIRLPQQLKERIAVAAKRAGTTPHALILEAIAQKAEENERRNDFHRVAEDRYTRIAASGKTISWKEMRRYIGGRSTGKKARRPRARKLAP
jgi:predicted DNA-binding protein